MTTAVAIAHELEQLFRTHGKRGLTALLAEIDRLRAVHGEDAVVAALAAQHATLVGRVAGLAGEAPRAQIVRTDV